MLESLISWKCTDHLLFSEYEKNKKKIIWSVREKRWDISLVNFIINKYICEFSDTWNLLRLTFKYACHCFSVTRPQFPQSMDICNACFRFRTRIIVIYNSRTKGPMTVHSGTDQFESISRRFANLLEINVTIFYVSLKKEIYKYPTERSR